MKRLLLVADPIGGANSVQFEILDSLAHGLGSRYHFTVYSPHIDPESAEVLAQKGCQLITPNGHGFAFNRFLQARGSHNESMLWAESWMQEALLQRNTQDASNFVNGDQFDYTVNLSMTVPSTATCGGFSELLWTRRSAAWLAPIQSHGLPISSAGDSWHLSTPT